MRDLNAIELAEKFDTVITAEFWMTYQHHITMMT
jgi:hypothetical protein